MAGQDSHSPFRIEKPHANTAQFEDDNYDGPQYSDLNGNGVGGGFGDLIRKFGLLIGIVAIGICVLAVVLLVFPKKPAQDNGLARIQALKAQIEQLKEQVVQLEARQTEMDQLKTQGQRAEQLLGRMNQLEATTAQRMEELSQKLIEVEKLAKKPAPPPPAPAPAPKAPAKSSTKKATKAVPAQPAPAKPATAKPAAKYHTVQAGENLYRISLKYGLSVEELQKLNNLSGTTISVGARLKVSK